MLHDKMLAAVDACYADALAGFPAIEALPPADRLDAFMRIASNLSPERAACEIRLRAEHRYSVLLRDAAGLPPKNRRDARMLHEQSNVGQRPSSSNTSSAHTCADAPGGAPS